MLHRLGAGVLGAIVWLATVMPASGTQSLKARGRTIAETHCARCHAIGPEGASPLGLAPPFRDLPQRYPVQQLAEALAEGIMTGHADMPEFTFEPDEIAALLTYLQTLAPTGEPARGR